MMTWSRALRLGAFKTINLPGIVCASIIQMNPEPVHNVVALTMNTPPQPQPCFYNRDLNVTPAPVRW